MSGARSAEILRRKAEAARVLSKETATGSVRELLEDADALDAGAFALGRVEELERVVGTLVLAASRAHEWICGRWDGDAEILRQLRNAVQVSKGMHPIPEAQYAAARVAELEAETIRAWSASKELALDLETSLAELAASREREERLSHVVRDLLQVAFDGPSEPKGTGLESVSDWRSRIEAIARAAIAESTSEGFPQTPDKLGETKGGGK